MLKYEDIKQNIESLLNRLESISDFVALCTNSFGEDVDARKLRKAVSKHYEGKSGGLQSIHKVLRPVVEGKIARTYERAEEEEGQYDVEQLAPGMYKVYSKTSLARGKLPETVFAANPSYIGVYTISLGGEGSIPTCTCPEFLSRAHPFGLPCKHIVMLGNRGEKQVVSSLIKVANSLDRGGFPRQADAVDAVLLDVTSLVQYAQDERVRGLLPALQEKLRPLLGGRSVKQIAIEIARKLARKGVQDIEQWFEKPENRETLKVMVKDFLHSLGEQRQTTMASLVVIADELDQVGAGEEADELDKLLQALREGQAVDEDSPTSGIRKFAEEGECALCDHDMMYEDMCPRCGWARNYCLECRDPMASLICPGCKTPVGFVKRAGIMGPLAGGALGTATGAGLGLAGILPGGALAAPLWAGIGGLGGAGAGPFVGEALRASTSVEEQLHKIAKELRQSNTEVSVAIRRLLVEAQGKGCPFCSTPYDEHGVCEVCGSLSPMHKCSCLTVEAACAKCSSPLGEIPRRAVSGQLRKYAIDPATLMALTEAAPALAPGVSELLGGVGKAMPEAAKAWPEFAKGLPQMQKQVFEV